MFNNYNKRLLYLLLTKSKKIPAMLRLKMGTRKLAPAKLANDQNTAPFPVTIAIRPTYRCNLRCIQCAQWGEKGYLLGEKKEFFENISELTTDELKKFINDIAPFKPYTYFTGGEPMLRKDIFELIKFADSKNLITGMSSNCTMLEERAEEVVRSGLDYIYGSIDGPMDINERIRLGNDSSVRAIQGIKALVKARDKLKTKLPIIEIRMTVTKENQHHIIETAKFVEEELEADAFCIAFEIFTTDKLHAAQRAIFKKEFNTDAICWTGFMRNNGQTEIDPDLVRDQIEQIKNSKWNFKFKLYHPIGEKGFDYNVYFNQPTQTATGTTFCSAVYAFTQLQPNGDLATCASIPDYIAGNIREHSFIEIWNGEKYKRFRNYLKVKLFPTCTKCKHLYTFKKHNR